MGKTDKHYLLHAYVCGEACVKWSDNIGWMTFNQVYNERPNNCRFAIAEERPDQVIVWDLYDVDVTPRWKLVTPPPFGVHTTVDAAVMATQMLYDAE